MRNGKIAKLLPTVRDELNLRMDNGENGGKLLRWLNALPEVKATLKASFGGLPISKQNLCEWRQGGFREWQLHYQWIHQAYELNRLTTDMEDVLDAPLLAGDMAKLLAVRYAALLNTWDGGANPKFERDLRLLRGLGQDIALLQRTLHRSSLQQIASDQRREDDSSKNKEKLRQLAMSPILARMEQNSMENMFAGFVDDQAAKRLAEFVIAIKFDLPLPKKPRPQPPGQTSRSNPEPSPVVASALCAERDQPPRTNPAPSAQPVKPSQSPPAPPGQTGSSLVKPKKEL
ncbi:MAG: hypothetical protein ABSG78_01640 [Verrucomicrobiota bacterium]|jgi:hypothetical protein